METFVKLLIVNAKMAFDSCAVGNPCPAIEQRYERLRNPKIGDLVLEISNQSKWTYHPFDSIGRLIMRKEEPLDEEGDSPTTVVWYVETFDNRIIRWTNCSFIAVSEMDEWEAQDNNKTGFFTEDQRRMSLVNSAKLRHSIA